MKTVSQICPTPMAHPLTTLVSHVDTDTPPPPPDDDAPPPPPDDEPEESLSSPASEHSRLSSTNSTNSTNSTPPHDNEPKFSVISTPHDIHEAIIPSGTILTAYLAYARKYEESADCYLLGSALAMVAGMLGRSVFFPWGHRAIYPNLFVILVGKPGDRKSSAISIAERLGKALLPSNRFLPATGSAEAYFDEFDSKAGGSPDKVMVCEDANILLSTWKNTNYGENVAKKFLELYDCCSLSESFKRNLKSQKAVPGEQPSPRRHIEQTSTTVLLGATHNAASFSSQDIKGGLQRRFLYYVAERHGRMIVLPEITPTHETDGLRDLFRPLLDLRISACAFTPGAESLWKSLQIANRQSLDSACGDAVSARLNSQPVQVLKVAMCFQACRVAGTPWDGRIEEDVLAAAIRHVQLCFVSAGHLEKHGSQAELQEKAVVVYHRILHDFGLFQKDGVITLSRSDLTSKFCHHDRPGSLRTGRLYDEVIPLLISQGLAKQLPNEGKLQRYGFMKQSG